MKKRYLVIAASLTALSISSSIYLTAANADSKVKSDTHSTVNNISELSYDNPETAESVTLNVTSEKVNSECDDVSNEKFVLKKSLITDTEKPSKENVLHMMLNSIDYYDYASGTVTYATPNDVSCPIIVDFQSNIPNTEAYMHVVQKRIDVKNLKELIRNSDTDMLLSKKSAGTIYRDTESYLESDKEMTLNNVERTYSNMSYSNISRSNVAYIADDKRFEIDENGIPHYHYRANPTNVGEASMCLFPQEMAFGFLLDTDMWDIDGLDKYDGRDCVIISGKTNEEYGKKIGVTTFTFYVDSKTGTLLKYIGYDENGDVSDYLLTKDISFDNNFDVSIKSSDVANKVSNYDKLD